MQLVIGGLGLSSQCMGCILYIPYIEIRIYITRNTQCLRHYETAGHDNLLGEVAYVYPAAVKILKW